MFKQYKLNNVDFDYQNPYQPINVKNMFLSQFGKGLGYVPQDYVIGGMIGGIVIEHFNKNKKIITDIRPYNDDDLNDININNDVEDDATILKNHIKYMKIPKNIEKYLKNNKIDENEFVIDVIDDMEKIYNLNDIGVNMSIDLSQRMDEIIKNEDLSNIEKKRELEEYKASLEKNLEEQRLKRINNPKLENLSAPIIAILKKQIKTAEQEIININNIENPNNKQKILPIKPSYVNIMDVENDERTLPKRYKFIPNKETIKQVEKLNEAIKDTTKKYKKHGITNKEFIDNIIPTGGAKEFENKVEASKILQKEIYKKAGLEEASENPQLENLQVKFGTNTNLPIDTVDWKNNIFNELKKYVKYNYNDLYNDLTNRQINFFQNKILDEINLLLGQENKNKSYKEIERINEIYNNFIKEDGVLDREKVIDFINKEIGGISLPIGTTKFGNIGIFEGNKLNNISTREYVIQEGLNDNWKIVIDYNKILDGKINPNYGKVISLKKINKEKGKVSYGEETVKKPFDYIFTIATKNDILVLNYTDLVKKEGIKSPMDIFKVGDDFYDKSSDKISYYIPLNYFKKIPKTSYLNPSFEDDEIIENLDAIINKDDIPEELIKYNNIFNKYVNEYKKIEEAIKTTEKDIELFTKKFFKGIQITNFDRSKGELEKILKNKYPIQRTTNKEQNKNKRIQYMSMYEKLKSKNEENNYNLIRLINNVKKDIKKTYI